LNIKEGINEFQADGTGFPTKEGEKRDFAIANRENTLSNIKKW